MDPLIPARVPSIVVDIEEIGTNSDNSGFKPLIHGVKSVDPLAVITNSQRYLADVESTNAPWTRGGFGLRRSECRGAGGGKSECRDIGVVGEETLAKELQRCSYGILKTVSALRKTGSLERKESLPPKVLTRIIVPHMLQLTLEEFSLHRIRKRS